MYWIWFTDRNCKPLEIEDKTNVSLVINWCITYKVRCSLSIAMSPYPIEPRDKIFVIGYGFWS